MDIKIGDKVRVPHLPIRSTDEGVVKEIRETTVVIVFEGERFPWVYGKQEVEVCP